MMLLLLLNACCTTIFAQNLLCVNASFETVCTNNLIVDSGKEWHVSISNASIVNEDVSCGMIFN